jgi:hypothetical protein
MNEVFGVQPRHAGSSVTSNPRFLTTRASCIPCADRSEFNRCPADHGSPSCGDIDRRIICNGLYARTDIQPGHRVLEPSAGIIRDLILAKPSG